MFRHATRPINMTNPKVNSTGRFPVIVHANYCNGKSHELSVRGLWLLGDNYTDVDAEICRPYQVEHTFYNQLNWTSEVEQINHKRDYMYDAFVRNGSLIQGTYGLQVFAVDSSRRKRLIPDKDTFLELFGESFHLIKKVPSEVMAMVEEGPPLVSLKKPKGVRK